VVYRDCTARLLTAGRVTPVEQHSYRCPVTTSTRASFCQKHLSTSYMCYASFAFLSHWIPEHIAHTQRPDHQHQGCELSVGSTAPIQPRLRRWTRCVGPSYSLWAPRATDAPPRFTHPDSACTFCGGTRTSQSSVMQPCMGPPCSHPCPPPHSSRQSILCQALRTLTDSFSRNPPAARTVATTTIACLAPPCMQSAETIIRVPSQRAPTTGAPSQGCTAARGARARRTAPLRVRKCTGSREATSKPARR
jgi:hypothetical protein